MPSTSCSVQKCTFAGMEALVVTSSADPVTQVHKGHENGELLTRDGKPDNLKMFVRCRTGLGAVSINVA